MPRNGVAVPIALVGLLLTLAAPPATAQVSSRPASPAADALASAKSGKPGKLKVRILGLIDPPKVVTVKGPKKYKKKLKKTKKLKGLRPGKYVVKSKKKVSTTFATYALKGKPKQKVRVKKGKTAKVKVVYRDTQAEAPAQEEPLLTATPTATPQPTASQPTSAPASGPSQPTRPVGPTTPPPTTPTTPPSTSPPSSPSGSPMAPPGLSVKALAAGNAHSCAVLLAGAVYCWGDNDYGQLGDGTNASSPTPVQVSGITTAVDIDAGERFSCAVLSDGGVRCWGENAAGQLGDGTGGDGTDAHDSSSPVTVVDDTSNPLDSITEVALGQNHACALQSDSGKSSVWCWGFNNWGQVGVGSAGREEPRAKEAQGIGPNPTGVAAGSWYSCVRLRNANVECWGVNTLGQLGTGASSSSTTPVTVQLKPPGAARVGALQVDGGDDHACAVLANAEMKCWGANDEGQLNGSAQNPADTSGGAPVTVGITGAEQSAPGGFHSCALIDDGTVKCWGANFSGQTGNGTTDQVSGAAQVNGISDVGVLAAGTNHTCAASRNGKVYCWGSNLAGQSGAGPGNVLQPKEIPFS